MDWKKGIRDQVDLKVDYDSHRHNPIQRFNFRAKYLLSYFPDWSPMKVKVYKTKKGFHFYIYFLSIRELEPSEKVFLQAILGSDWLRELRNAYRISKNDKNWNILFSEKDKNGKLQYEKFYTAYTLKKR